MRNRAQYSRCGFFLSFFLPAISFTKTDHAPVISDERERQTGRQKERERTDNTHDGLQRVLRILKQEFVGGGAAIG